MTPTPTTMIANPFGCHQNAPTGPGKNTALTQHNARLLKVLSPDRGFLQAWRAQNPDGEIVLRTWEPGDNLKDWSSRTDVILKALAPVNDLVTTVETSYNEAHEGINADISELADDDIRTAEKIRAAYPHILVAGGNFSVGTPYNDVTQGQFQDWKAYSHAFLHLDRLSLHEYGNPGLTAGFVKLGGRTYGATVLRYRYVVDWARRQGLPIPPIIISEFGIDYGGGGQGFRSQNISITDYMNQARAVAPLLMADIAVGVLIGAVFFCVGNNDKESWGSFELAGESAFGQLLAEEFSQAIEYGPVTGSKIVNLVRRPMPTPAPTTVTQFSQWAAAATDHDPRDHAAYLAAFILHCEDVAGVMNGTYDTAEAIRRGYPVALLPAPVSQPTTQQLMERFTASRLAVPVERIQAIRTVESTGQPFGGLGRALIRTEIHLLLSSIPLDDKEWAATVFRVKDGVEQVNFDLETENAEWVILQDLEQSDRWRALQLAARIAGDWAYRYTSMGLFQILGLHFAALGYGSAHEMLMAFSHTEGAQWRGFEQFIMVQPGLHDALGKGDVAEFARLYNGQEEPYRTDLIEAGWR